MSIPSCKRYPAPWSLSRAPTDNYDQRYVVVNGKRYYYSRGRHGGSDIKPKRVGVAGDPLYTAWDGVIEEVGNVWGSPFGLQVLVRHWHRHSDGKGHAWWSFYAHLRNVRDGVKANASWHISTQLANMGQSGNVQNDHLHFELHTENDFESTWPCFSRLDVIRRKELAA